MTSFPPDNIMQMRGCSFQDYAWRFEFGLEHKAVRSTIILMAVLVFLPANFWAQTPTCSNLVDQMEAEVYAGVAPGTTTVYLPNPTGAGNAIIVGTSGTDGTTF